MKGRVYEVTNKLKKDLTVTPFIPGAPTPITYSLYKIKGGFIYTPKYFSKDGKLIENKVKYCDIKVNGVPRDYQSNVIKDIHAEIIKNESCIACLYTGWGKTFAALYIASLLGVKTLILVNTFWISS